MERFWLDLHHPPALQPMREASCACLPIELMAVLFLNQSCREALDERFVARGYGCRIGCRNTNLAEMPSDSDAERLLWIMLGAMVSKLFFEETRLLLDVGME